MPALDMTQIIYIITALGALGAVVSFALPFLKRRKRANRIKSVVSRHRGDLSRAQLENLSQGPRQKKSKLAAYAEMAQTVLQRLRLEGLLSQQKVKMFLAQGGFRSRSALAIYAASRMIGIPVGMIAAVILIKVLKGDYPFMIEMAFWGFGGFLGFFLPKVIVSNAAQKRQVDMNKAFPDALDLLVICVEAGLSIEAAFDRVTREIAEASDTLAQEMGLATAELAYLGDRAKAYQNFAERTGLPAARALATALIQTERYGTPVSVAVKVLAQEKRQERLSAAEKKAAALPAKLTVPMIIFFLPVLFIVVIGPAIIQAVAL